MNRGRRKGKSSRRTKIPPEVGEVKTSREKTDRAPNGTGRCEKKTLEDPQGKYPTEKEGGQRRSVDGRERHSASNGGVEPMNDAAKKKYPLGPSGKKERGHSIKRSVV